MIRRMIVRAAPTCTLWTISWVKDVLIFRPWPRWVITMQEYYEVKA